MLIATYWVLRIVRDTLFETLIGLNELPTARLLSVIATVPLVLGYGKIVDYVTHREYILYFIYFGYTLIYVAIALLTLGVSITTPSFEGSVVGWVAFFSVETFGSIGFSAFWTFVTDSVAKDSAPKFFPIVTSAGQLGSMAGPVFAGVCIHEFSYQSGVFICFLCSGLCLFLCIIMIQLFISLGREGAQSNKQKKSEMSLLDGVLMIGKDPYVLGLFSISTIYHVIGTITDYQMKKLAQAVYPDPAQRMEFMASFGFCTNVFSFVFSFFGTSYFLRKIGLTWSLLTYALSVFVSLLVTLVYPDLYVLFASLIVLKGLSYALNNPAKETLYVVTSTDVKYKVKSWIDMFGQRMAKAVGAFMISLPFLRGLDALMSGGTLISMVFAVLWMGAAYKTGQQYERLKKKETRTEYVNEKED